MNSPTFRGQRPIFKWVHTWIGLVAGLVIVVVSLTGSVIVFRNEIGLASVPRGAGGSGAVGLDEVVRQMAQAKPDAQVRRVRFPEQSGDPYVVQVQSGGKQERVAVDASTGRSLGTLKTGMVDWTVDLHRNLLAGKTGRSAVGVVGIVLFTLAGTGMLLWLMGARKWRAWISVKPQSGSRRLNFELHRAVGLWSYGLLTVVSFAGIGLAFPDTFRSTLQHMTGSPAPAKAPRVAKGSGGALRPLDEYMRAAASAMPDGVPTELRLPEGDKGPVDLRLRRPGDLTASGNHVYLEPVTGKVLAVSKLADQPLAARIFATFAPIHYGEFGGLPIKIVWGALGVIPSVLFVTGLLTWWRPKRKAPAVREEFAVVESREPAGRGSQRRGAGTLGGWVETRLDPFSGVLASVERRQECRRCRQECPIPRAISTAEIPNELVGRTPWSARNALVPPVREESVGCDHRGADQGGGRGRGRPPHYLCYCPKTGKVRGIGQECLRHVNNLRPST